MINSKLLCIINKLLCIITKPHNWNEVESRGELCENKTIQNIKKLDLGMRCCTLTVKKISSLLNSSNMYFGCSNYCNSKRENVTAVKLVFNALL